MSSDSSESSAFLLSRVAVRVDGPDDLDSVVLLKLPLLVFFVEKTAVDCFSSLISEVHILTISGISSSITLFTV